MNHIKGTVEIVIAKTLKQAVALGPEHTADLIRQKLTVLLFQLEKGIDPVLAVRQFQVLLGMDEILMSIDKISVGEGK